MKIYRAGNRIMNTYVYPVANGYVMIDTGYEHSLKSVVKRLNKQRIDISEIKYLFLTHAHDDHAGFLNELLSKYPHLKVIASDQSIPVLLKGQNSFDGGCSSFLALLFCKFMALIGKGEHLFPGISNQHIDRFITCSEPNTEHAEKLLQGKILFTPGHTSDSISLKVDNILFCGDAAMNGFPSLHKITIWIEDPVAFERSWNRILRETADFIYPAHGKPFHRNALAKNIHFIRKLKLYPLR